MYRESYPLVSVCMITYNHESYIAEAIEGVLGQKANFPFELVISEDQSADGTRNIVQGYALKYPEIIVYDPAEKNRGMSENFHHNLSLARGKYIALCEGDDYWTDPLKLQKQIDFMEANAEYSMCFHGAMVKWEDGRPGNLFCNLEDRDYTGVEIYRDFIVPTASAIVRKDILDSDLYRRASINPNFCYGDILIWLSAAKYGKIRATPDCMSVYRKHIGGAVYRATTDKIKKMCIHNIEIHRLFGKQYLRDAKKIVISRCQDYYIMLLVYEKSYKDGLWFLKFSLKNFPFATLYSFLLRISRIVTKGSNI